MGRYGTLNVRFMKKSMRVQYPIFFLIYPNFTSSVSMVSHICPVTGASALKYYKRG